MKRWNQTNLKFDFDFKLNDVVLWHFIKVKWTYRYLFVFFDAIRVVGFSALSVFNPIAWADSEMFNSTDKKNINSNIKKKHQRSKKNYICQPGKIPSKFIGFERVKVTLNVASFWGKVSFMTLFKGISIICFITRTMLCLLTNEIITAKSSENISATCDSLW